MSGTSKNHSQSGLSQHQERVNRHILHAIEQLGTRIQNTENEKNSLKSRLSELEHATGFNPETGELRLPMAPIIHEERIKARNGMRSVMFMTAFSVLMASTALTVAIKERFVQIEQQKVQSLGIPQFSSLAPNSSAWRPLSGFAHQDGTAADAPIVLASSEKKLIPQYETAVEAQPEETVTEVTEYVAEAKPAPQPEIAPAPVSEVAEESVPDLTVAMAHPPAEIVTPAEEVETAPEPEPVLDQTLPVTEETIPEPEIEQAAVQKDQKVQKKPVVTHPEPESESDPVVLTRSSLPKEPVKRVEPAEPTYTAKAQTSDNNLPASARELEEAAMLGQAEAQHDLATLYASGQAGVEVDFNRARYWFEEAAKSGIANAHYNLGVMYHQGLGVDPNLKEAIYYYEQAAALGHPEAQYNMGVVHVEGVGTDVNYEYAANFFENAAKNGIVQGAFNLGALHESGLLGKTDLQQSIFWYMKAAEVGHIESRGALVRLTGDELYATDQAYATFDSTGQEDYSEVQPAAGYYDDTTIIVQDAPLTLADLDDLEEVGSTESQNEIIRDIQRMLIAMKLHPGPANGILNNKTEDAIRAYQEENGLYIDGVASPELLDYMISAQN